MEISYVNIGQQNHVTGLPSCDWSASHVTGTLASDWLENGFQYLATHGRVDNNTQENTGNVFSIILAFSNLPLATLVRQVIVNNKEVVLRGQSWSQQYFFLTE